jgi:hypothetical protein
MKKNKNYIYFEELPKRLQHALEILVEWHSVLVYEIRKGMYGFYILDKYMPIGADFTDLIESEYVNAHHFIQKSILEVIETKFKGIRCRYFPKGYFDSEMSEIEIFRLCEFKDGLGFSIELHSNDYGFLNEEKARIAPAYAHVLDENGLEIGLLNISGPCPKKISDIKEFRPPHIPGKVFVMKKTPLLKHRKNIVKWANILVPNGKTNWDEAQNTWKGLRDTHR